MFTSLCMLPFLQYIDSSLFVVILASWDPLSFEKTLEPVEIPQSLRHQHVFYILSKDGGQQMSLCGGFEPSQCCAVQSCSPRPQGQMCTRTSWAYAATKWWSGPCGGTLMFCSPRLPHNLWWLHRSSCSAKNVWEWPSSIKFMATKHDQNTQAG